MSLSMAAHRPGSAVLALVTVLAAALLTGCGKTFPKAHPAAVAPKDLCALIDKATLAVLVPDAKTPEHDAKYDIYGGSARCFLQSLPGADSKPFGDLSLDLDRNGASHSSTPEREAIAMFEQDKANLAARPHVRHVGDIAGLADAAYAVTSTFPVRGTQADLVVRRGADVLSVVLISDPSTQERTLGAVEDVARQVFARL
jgi:hypothetical protein